MTTYTELQTWVGTTAMLHVERRLSVPVTVLDGREVFGRLDLLVSPVGGSGQTWVSADRLERKEEG